MTAPTYLTKAQEYVLSAEHNLAAGRLGVAASNAIHAGVLAKNAIVGGLAGGTVAEEDDVVAEAAMREALDEGAGAAEAVSALRQLLASRHMVESSTTTPDAAVAADLVRQARILVQRAAIG